MQSQNTHTHTHASDSRYRCHRILAAEVTPGTPKHAVSTPPPPRYLCVYVKDNYIYTAHIEKINYPTYTSRGDG